MRTTAPAGKSRRLATSSAFARSQELSPRTPMLREDRGAAVVCGARCGHQTMRASGSASDAKGAAGGALHEENEDHVSTWPAGSTDERNLWIWTCGRTCQQPATRRVCGANGAGNACAGCGDSPRSMHTMSLEATRAMSASPFLAQSPLVQRQA